MEEGQSEFVQLHAIVEGHVQGVGFRYFVLQNAVQLGLTGWVRNTWDDKVEVCAEGPRPALETLAELLRSGPRNSNVTAIKPDWQPASSSFTSFKVLSSS